MERRFARRLVWLIVVLIVLAVSVLALEYSSWLRAIEESNRALESGNVTAALEGYDKAQRAVALLPSPTTLLPTGYRQLIYNRARALYLAQRQDELARFLEAESAIVPQLADDAEYQYWMGNIQFTKALGQKEKQQVQSGLQQAAESYHRALSASPEDWDIKYNYELSSRLLEGLRRGKDDELEKMKRGQMKLLREDNETKQEQQKLVAPEKRG